MVKVLLNNVVLAESATPVILEGNYYFPPETVRKAYLKVSDTSTVCPWKGYRPDRPTEIDFVFDSVNHRTASYYSADADGKTVKDVAWYYVDPKPKAVRIKGHVAFYKNKVIIED